jgi:hypothetical protein
MLKYSTSIWLYQLARQTFGIIGSSNQASQHPRAMIGGVLPVECRSRGFGQRKFVSNKAFRPINDAGIGGVLLVGLGNVVEARGRSSVCGDDRHAALL